MMYDIKLPRQSTYPMNLKMLLQSYILMSFEFKNEKHSTVIYENLFFMSLRGK